MKYIFKSDRLGFRNWLESDNEPFSDLNKDKEVMEFFPNTLTTEQSDGLIGRMKKHFFDKGCTFYAVDELESGKFIGFIGIVIPRFEAFFTPCYEIGWRLARSFWNKGYATEGAIATLEYAFTNLDIKEIYSITSIHNTKSAHIMKKIGMKKIGEFDHPQLPDGHYLQKHVVYNIERKN